MPRKVFNLEVSSALSDTYDSGLEVVVVSALEVVEGVVEGAGDSLVLLVDDSREVAVIITEKRETWEILR